MLFYFQFVFSGGFQCFRAEETLSFCFCQYRRFVSAVGQVLILSSAERHMQNPLTVDFFMATSLDFILESTLLLAFDMLTQCCNLEVSKSQGHY